MKKLISTILAIMLFFGITTSQKTVTAMDPEPIINAVASPCKESSAFLIPLVIIEGILLLGCGMYIGHQCWAKKSKYNKTIKVRQNLIQRTGDISPLPLIEKILKCDIPRALNSEAVNTADIYCIFELTFNRLNFYTQTPRVQSAKKELATYKATFDSVCAGESAITIRQFEDMLKKIRDMY